MNVRLDVRVPVGLLSWARLAGWSAALALTTAAYGLLVGPLLRALFGGEHLTWPGELADVLPPPPSVSDLRAWLPGLLVAVALVKGLASHRHAVATARLGQRVIRQLRGRVFRHLLQLTPDAAGALGAGDFSRGCSTTPRLWRRWRWRAGSYCCGMAPRSWRCWPYVWPWSGGWRWWSLASTRWFSYPWRA